MFIEQTSKQKDAKSLNCSYALEIIYEVKTLNQTTKVFTSRFWFSDRRNLKGFVMTKICTPYKNLNIL